MISVETGKTVAKLGKGIVRNGNCIWTETLVESVLISKDDFSKELEERLFKFVISMVMVLVSWKLFSISFD